MALLAGRRRQHPLPPLPPLLLLLLLLLLLGLAQSAAGDEESAGGATARLRGAAAAGAPSSLRQVLVFDAGSSGTRVHIFNVRLVPGAHVPEVNQSVRTRQTLKVKPGLSQYAQANDTEGLQASIRRLLDFADHFVESGRRPSTPCLVKATAGLRAIPAEKANMALETVRTALAASSYMSSRAWVEIIPGKEEGGLAWLAANYLAGTFRRSSKTTGSLGVIEMGGGSTQVSFEVVDKNFKLAELDTFEFTTLTGRSFRVYAHSYLGYGQDHAQDRMQALLPPEGLKEQFLARQPQDHLRYLGQERQDHFLSEQEKMLEEHHQRAQEEDPCYPRGFKYRRRHENGTLLPPDVQGIGNAEACILSVHQRLFGAPRASDAPGRYAEEPPLRGDFVATENFYYVRADLSLPLLGDPKTMEEAAKNVCKKKFKDAAAEPPKHCFALSYQAAFLQALRRRPPTKAPPRGADGGAGFVAAVAAAAAEAKVAAQDKVNITRRIRGGDVDWALGAALMHVIVAERSAAAAGAAAAAAAATAADEAQRLHGALPGGLTEPDGAALALAAAATAGLLLLAARRLRAHFDDTSGKSA